MSIKSGDKVTIDSLNDLQKSSADSANSIELDHVSRGTFGPEHLVDSVIFTARSFRSEQSELVGGDGGWYGQDGRAGIAKHNPSGVGSGAYYWGKDLVGPDFTVGWSGNYYNNITRDFNDPVAMHLHRRHWHKIKSACSQHYSDAVIASGADADERNSVLGVVNTADWRAEGGGGGKDFTSYKSRFGERFFKIGNNGRSFALLFNCNLEAKFSATFRQDNKERPDIVGTNRWKEWEGGCRVWTSIIYFLKPNPTSPFVLKWSPRHMIGCSAASYQKEKGALNSPMINEVHSYQDVIQVNQTMIDSLCKMSGKNSSSLADGMKLDGDAQFGWATVAGIDRWDGVLDKGSRFDSRRTLEGEDDTGIDEYTYRGGQPVSFDNINCSFVAFNYSVPATESGNVSLYNNFVGL